MATNGWSIHGRSRTPEYRVWGSLIQRASNPSDKRFHDYGARGITVCQRWRAFADFFDDMGPRPAGTSIDRIDNNGGYWCGKCPECISHGRPANCRWATTAVQARNKSQTVWITVDDRTQCLTDWANEIGVTKKWLGSRVNAVGPESAVRAALNGQRPGDNLLHLIEYCGEKMSVTEAARRSGIPAKTLSCRIVRGWSAHELFKPIVGKSDARVRRSVAREDAAIVQAKVAMLKIAKAAL